MGLHGDAVRPNRSRRNFTSPRRWLIRCWNESASTGRWSSSGRLDKGVTITGSRPRGASTRSRLLEICGYIGPAPVSLEAYAAMLRWQFAATPQVRAEQRDRRALGTCHYAESRAVRRTGCLIRAQPVSVRARPETAKAASAGKLHAALPGDYWIPYAISVGNDVIRLYDEQAHERVGESPRSSSASIDQRWVRIRRPLVVVGGELTLESLDLMYSPALHQYEAPPHLEGQRRRVPGR